jgi:hypothetical protein
MFCRGFRFSGGGKAVYNHKADIMPGILVGGPGVAESDDKNQ